MTISAGRMRSSVAASRSAFTRSGTCRRMPAAGVPGRLLYLKEKACAKPISRTSAMVAAKSASVSPGKPTMKSDDSAMSGRAARRSSTTRLKSSAE